MAEVLLTRKAERDLERVPPAELRQIRDALRALGNEQWTGRLNIKALVGLEGWIRLRSGDWRIIYRYSAGDEPPGACIVARVVNRRDLDRAIRSL